MCIYDEQYPKIKYLNIGMSFQNLRSIYKKNESINYLNHVVCRLNAIKKEKHTNTLSYTRTYINVYLTTSQILLLLLQQPLFSIINA